MRWRYPPFQPVVAYKLLIFVFRVRRYFVHETMSSASIVLQEILPLILATRQPKKSSLIAQRLISLSQGEDPGENNIAQLENERYDPNSQEDECQIVEEFNENQDDLQAVNNDSQPVDSTENDLPSADNTADTDHSDDIFKRFSVGPRENDRYHYFKNNVQGNAESQLRDSVSNNTNKIHSKTDNQSNPSHSISKVNTNAGSQPSDSMCGSKITTVRRTDIPPKNNPLRPNRMLIPITNQKKTTRTSSLKTIRLSNDEQMLPDSTNSLAEISDCPHTPTSNKLPYKPPDNQLVILSITTNKKSNENTNEQASSTTVDFSDNNNKDVSDPNKVLPQEPVTQPTAMSTRRLHVKHLYDTRNRTALDSLLSRIMAQSTLGSDDLLAISEIYEARKCLALGQELHHEPKNLNQPRTNDQKKPAGPPVDQSKDQKKSVAQATTKTNGNQKEEREKNDTNTLKKGVIQNTERKEKETRKNDDNRRELANVDCSRDRDQMTRDANISNDVIHGRDYDELNRERYHSRHRSPSPRSHLRNRSPPRNDPRQMSRRSPSPRYDCRDRNDRLTFPRNRSHRSPSPRNDPRNRAHRSPSPRNDPRNRYHRSPSPNCDPRHKIDRLPSPINDPRNEYILSDSPHYQRNRVNRPLSPRNDPRYRSNRSPSPRYDPRNRSNRPPSPRNDPRNGPHSPHYESRNRSLSPRHYNRLDRSPSPRYNTRDMPPRTPSPSRPPHETHRHHKRHHIMSPTGMQVLEAISCNSADLDRNITTGSIESGEIAPVENRIADQFDPSLGEAAQQSNVDKLGSSIESGEIESGEITDSENDFSFSDPAKSPKGKTQAMDRNVKRGERSRTPIRDRTRSHHRHHSSRLPEHPRDRNVVNEYKPPDVENWLLSNFPSTPTIAPVLKDKCNTVFKDKSKQYKLDKLKNKSSKQKGDIEKESNSKLGKSSNSSRVTILVSDKFPVFVASSKKVLASQPNLESVSSKQNPSAETKDSSSSLTTASDVKSSKNAVIETKSDSITPSSNVEVSKLSSKVSTPSVNQDTVKQLIDLPCKDSNTEDLKADNSSEKSVVFNVSDNTTSVDSSKSPDINVAIYFDHSYCKTVAPSLNTSEDVSALTSSKNTSREPNKNSLLATGEVDVSKPKENAPAENCQKNISENNSPAKLREKVSKSDQNNVEKVTKADTEKPIASSPPAPHRTKKSSIFTRLNPLVSSESSALNDKTDKPPIEETNESSTNLDVSKEDDAYPNLGYHSEGEISLSDEDSIYSTSHLIPDINQVMLQEITPLMELRVPTPENAHFSPRRYADYPKLYDEIDPQSPDRREISPSFRRRALLPTPSSPVRSRSPRHKRVSSPETRSYSRERSPYRHHSPHYKERSLTPPHSLCRGSPPDSLALSRSGSPRQPERIVRRSLTPEEIDLRTLLQSLQAPVGLPSQDELEPIHCAVYGEETYCENPEDFRQTGPLLRVSLNFGSEEMYGEEERSSRSRHDYRRSSDGNRDYCTSEEYRSEDYRLKESNTRRSSDHHRSQRRHDARPLRGESQRERNTGATPRGRGANSRGRGVNTRARGVRPEPRRRPNTDGNNEEEDLNDELFDPGELFKPYDNSTSDLYNPTSEHRYSSRGHSSRGHNYTSRGHSSRGHNFAPRRQGSNTRGQSSSNTTVRRGGRRTRAASSTLEHLYKM